MLATERKSKKLGLARPASLRPGLQLGPNSHGRYQHSFINDEKALSKC